MPVPHLRPSYQSPGLSSFEHHYCSRRSSQRMTNLSTRKLTINSEHCNSNHTQNATRHTWLPINFSSPSGALVIRSFCRTCYILIKLLQLFEIPFQQLFANKWNLACCTTNNWLLISDTISTFQTNAGNIILTASKLHIRAIHHTLSEIGTKRWFCYQGIAIRRITKVKNRW